VQAVHHAYARHCEAIGDLKSAMQHYIASGTAAAEVSAQPEAGNMLSPATERTQGAASTGLECMNSATHQPSQRTLPSSCVPSSCRCPACCGVLRTCPPWSARCCPVMTPAC
jgi:hypothetical protein